MPLSLKVLSLLEASGWLSTPELSAALGKPSRTLWPVLARLARGGLVVRAGTAATPPGKRGPRVATTWILPRTEAAVR